MRKEGRNTIISDSYRQCDQEGGKRPKFDGWLVKVTRVRHPLIGSGCDVWDPRVANRAHVMAKELLDELLSRLGVLFGSEANNERFLAFFSSSAQIRRCFKFPLNVF